MRKAVRAIVIKGDSLLVMRRNKFGQRYFTLVGGGIDENETAEQALVREVEEETGLEIANPRLVFVEEVPEPFGTQYIYLCDYVSGEPALHPESQEAADNALGQNLREPMWLPINSLGSTNLLSETLKKALIEGLQNGFPASTKKLA